MALIAVARPQLLLSCLYNSRPALYEGNPWYRETEEQGVDQERLSCPAPYAPALKLWRDLERASLMPLEKIQWRIGATIGLIQRQIRLHDSPSPIAGRSPIGAERCVQEISEEIRTRYLLAWAAAPLQARRPKTGTRRQPSAVRVIVVEEPADRLFGRMDALDRVSSATRGLGQSNYHGLLRDVNHARPHRIDLTGESGQAAEVRWSLQPPNPRTEKSRISDVGVFRGENVRSGAGRRSRLSGELEKILAENEAGKEEGGGGRRSAVSREKADRQDTHSAPFANSTKRDPAPGMSPLIPGTAREGTGRQPQC